MSSQYGPPPPPSGDDDDEGLVSYLISAPTPVTSSSSESSPPNQSIFATSTSTTGATTTTATTSTAPSYPAVGVAPPPPPFSEQASFPPPLSLSAPAPEVTAPPAPLFPFVGRLMPGMSALGSAPTPTPNSGAELVLVLREYENTNTKTSLPEGGEIPLYFCLLGGASGRGKGGGKKKRFCWIPRNRIVRMSEVEKEHMQNELVIHFLGEGEGNAISARSILNARLARPVVTLLRQNVEWVKIGFWGGMLLVLGGVWLVSGIAWGRVFSVSTGSALDYSGLFFDLFVVALPLCVGSVGCVSGMLYAWVWWRKKGRKEYWKWKEKKGRKKGGDKEKEEEEEELSNINMRKEMFLPEVWVWFRRALVVLFPLLAVVFSSAVFLGVAVQRGSSSSWAVTASLVFGLTAAAIVLSIVVALLIILCKKHRRYFSKKDGNISSYGNDAETVRAEGPAMNPFGVLLLPHIRSLLTEWSKDSEIRSMISKFSPRRTRMRKRALQILAVVTTTCVVSCFLFAISAIFFAVATRVGFSLSGPGVLWLPALLLALIGFPVLVGFGLALNTALIDVGLQQHPVVPVPPQNMPLPLQNLPPLCPGPTAEGFVDPSTLGMFLGGMSTSRQQPPGFAVPPTSAVAVENCTLQPVEPAHDGLLQVINCENASAPTLVLSSSSGPAAVPRGSPSCLLSPLHFETCELVASGSFSVVYRGVFRMAVKETNVAIKRVLFSKIPHEEVVSEVLVMHDCKHANVVAVWGFYVSDDSTFVVMDWCETDLQRFLLGSDEGRRASPRDRVWAILEIAKGVGYLHSRGVVHRDLKLENILVQRLAEGADLPSSIRIKIADFGLAKQTQLVQGTVAGTIGYIPPELFTNQGKIEVPELLDTYSYGVLSWEVLAGQSLQSSGCARPSIELLGSVGVHAGVQLLIQQCISESPQDRPRFEFVTSLLQSALEGLD